MDNKKDEISSLRGSRGRGNRIGQVDKGREQSPSPRSNQIPRKNSGTQSPKQNNRRGFPERNGRIVRRGQQGPIQRRSRGMRPPMRNRNRRGQNSMRFQQRRPRRRFRPTRRRIFGMRRIRQFGKRSIFISGIPKNLDHLELNQMLQKEGKVLRFTLLKDRFGNSRGIAFAELQNPREAWNIIKKYNGYKIKENQIFVAFKREPRRYGNFMRYRNRFGMNRNFGNFRRFNPRQQLNRSFGNRMRGRFRRGGRGRF